MKTKGLFKIVSIFSLVLGATLFLSGCHNKPKQLEQTELEGFWVLKSLNGKAAKEVFSGAIPTLEFNFQDSIIYGTGGCNRYTGGFTYEEGFLSAPNLASTMMLCTEDNAEPQFLLALSNVNNIPSIVDGVLTITHDGVVVLEFEKGTPQTVAQPVGVDANTLKGTWNLKSIDGAEAGSLYAEAVPTLTFDFAENRVYGNAGCNSYNAQFSLTDAQLILGPVITTRMACPNLEGEGLYTQAIADTSSLTLPNENVLQLTKKGTVLLVFEKATEQAEAGK